MEILAEYSHLNGREWIEVHKPTLKIEIEKTIKAVQADRTKKSKEIRMKGKMLLAPKSINAAFVKEFSKTEWKSRRKTYYTCSCAETTSQILRLAPKAQKALIETNGLVAHRSYNQTDFIKDEIAVEVQFGKYSFVPYDIFAKHMGFFAAGEIKVGVEIVPMKVMQAQMSSGPGYYERTIHDIVRQGRGNPAVPLWLIGVAPPSLNLES